MYPRQMESADIIEIKTLPDVPERGECPKSFDPFPALWIADAHGRNPPINGTEMAEVQLPP